MSFTLNGKVIEKVISIIQEGILQEKDITLDLQSMSVDVSESELVLVESGGSRLSDKALTRVGQILSEAWITGTNIVDHLRLMKLEKDLDGTFTLTEEYVKTVEKNLQHQADEAENLKNEREKHRAEAVDEALSNKQ